MASCTRWFLAFILSNITLACLAHVSGYQKLVVRRIRREAPLTSVHHNGTSSSNSNLVASALVRENSPGVSEDHAGYGVEEQLSIRGQEVVLECLVTGRSRGDDDGIVRWFHDGREVTEDLRVTITWSGRLILSHSIAEDSGIWQCTRYGKEGTKIRLLVTIPPGRPFLVYGGAQLSPGARITTREGNPITVNCIVNGANPAPDITWMLIDEDISPQSQLVSVWQREEGTFSSVSNVSLAAVDKTLNNKTIECIVQHPALPRPVHVTLSLNVEYSPDFRLRRWPAWGTPVRMGTDVILLCLVDSNPISLPLWLKEQEGRTEEIGGTSSGGWLNLTHVTAQDRGWYKCSTTYQNSHFASHSVFINVQRRVLVVDKSSSPRVLEMSKLSHLPCTISSSTLPFSVCWHNMLKGGGPSSGAVTSSSIPQLRKTAYTATNSGRYRCLAADTAQKGDTETGDVEIRLPGSPVVTSVNKSVGAVGGGSVALTTHVCGLVDGRGLSWMPPSQLPPIIKAGQRYPRLYAHNLTSSGNPGCHFAVLTIVGVESHDAGGWVAVAANSVGAHASLVILNVTAEAQPMAVSDGHTIINSSVTQMVSKDVICCAVLISVMLQFAHQNGLW